MYFLSFISPVQRERSFPLPPIIQFSFSQRQCGRLCIALQRQETRHIPSSAAASTATGISPEQDELIWQRGLLLSLHLRVCFTVQSQPSTGRSLHIFPISLHTVLIFIFSFLFAQKKDLHVLIYNISQAVFLFNILTNIFWCDNIKTINTEIFERTAFKLKLCPLLSLHP